MQVSQQRSDSIRSEVGDYFETPPEVFAELHREFNFDLDACANDKNKLLDNFISEEMDALNVAWAAFGKSIFCNPPYSKEGQKDNFIMQAWLAAKDGATCVMLLPAKVNTKAFHFFMWDKKNHRPKPGVQIRFPEGRIKFWMDGKPSETTGQNECMIVVFKGIP